MVLPASITLTIAYALSQANFIGERQPINEIANTIGNLTVGFLQTKDITGIDIETLQAFKDEVVPCIYEVYEKYGNDTQGYGVMWVQCLKYVAATTAKPAPTCDAANEESLSHLVMFGLALILLCVMTCCVQRRHRACLSCCCGFPGPVIPLNMLDNYENRKGYMLAFGITVSSVVAVFLGDNRPLIGGFDYFIKEATKGRGYVTIFVKIFLSIYVAVIYYPFFIAQNIQNKLIGSAVGIFFVLSWIILSIYKMYVLIAVCLIQQQSQDQNTFATLAFFYDIPKYICMILLTGKFVYIIFKTQKQRAEKKKKGKRVNWLYEDDTNWRKEFAYIHVKGVFEKHLKVKDLDEEDSVDELPFTQKLIAKLKKKFYKIVPGVFKLENEKFSSSTNHGFQYSTRMMVSTICAVLAVYSLFITATFGGYIAFKMILDMILTNELIRSISDSTGIPLQTIEDYFNALQASYWCGLVLSLVLYAGVVMNSLTWYRRHILKLRIGDRSFLPSSIKNHNFNTGSLMVASFKFAGFQVAYAAWGFLLSCVIFWVAWFIIITQLFLPLVRHELSILLMLLVKLWPNILIAIAMVVFQRVLAICCFLHDSDTVAVDNRRAYHIMSYFLFYFNIFLGLGSCLVRIIFGLLFGVVFLQRLQKSTLPRSHERMDPGYLAYLGFILIEHQHSNPVLQCFVRLLLESQGMELKDEFFRNPQVESTAIISLVQGDFHIGEQDKQREERKRKSKIRNRWLLYKTLSLNPSLIKYRVRVIKVKKQKQSITLKLPSFGFNNDAYDGKWSLKKKLSHTDISKVEPSSSIHEKENNENPGIEIADDVVIVETSELNKEASVENDTHKDGAESRDVSDNGVDTVEDNEYSGGISLNNSNNGDSESGTIVIEIKNKDVC